MEKLTPEQEKKFREEIAFTVCSSINSLGDNTLCKITYCPTCTFKLVGTELATNQILALIKKAGWKSPEEYQNL